MTLNDVRYATIGDAGVLVADPAVGPLVLSLDGHYVWSLTPARDGRRVRGGVLVPWPHVLAPYLNGRAAARLTTADGSHTLYDGELVLGDGVEPIRVVDRRGYQLSVDKVGHLTRSFEATAESVRIEVLEGTQRVLRDLREHVGVEAYLNYGALLGAVRDGRMLGHDSDTDVCYLSRHHTPVDIIRESYHVERVMRARGWTLLRMSGGDLKVLFDLSDGRVCHIDIFVAFHAPGPCGPDTFYQLGNRSGVLATEAIVPVSTITLHGYEFPAPADPEAMLAFIYGPSWRVPDPSFTYADPPAGVRRLDGWLRGFRTDTGRWTEFLASPTARAIPRSRTDFARWANQRMPDDRAVVDLGTGTGRDAVSFARRGRRVIAVDYSRVGVRLAGRRLRNFEQATAEYLLIGDVRHALAFGARLARDPHELYARELLGCLDDAARQQLWLLCRMSLRAGGSLYLQFSATYDGAPQPHPQGLVRRLDPAAVRAEIEAAGGRIMVEWTGSDVDMEEYADPRVCRMRVVWPRPKPAHQHPGRKA